jgi:G3E family GTPase
LSKLDLVDQERAASAEDAVRAQNPAVPLLSQHAEAADVGPLLDIGVHHQAALESVLVDGRPGHQLPHTRTIPLPRRLHRDRFEALLHGLPATILRAKGFVAFDGEPLLHTFQYVEPGFVHIMPFPIARKPGLVVASGPASPYGVFIGTTIDEPWLRAALDACAP